MSDIITNRYSLGYNSAYDNLSTQFPVQTVLNKNFDIDQDAAWPLVLREFLTFLSAIYSYDISQKVFIQDICWEDSEPTYYPVSDYGA